MSFSLYIMRHAKSDWSTNVSDFDRPINHRGQKNAIRMGRWLCENDFQPELTICSAANRAKQTLELLRQEIITISSKDIILTHDLYLADIETLLDKIALYQHGVKSLLLIAHNPGLDHLAGYLSSQKLKTDQNGKLMTTAAVAIFEYENSQLTKPTRMQIIRPKELS